MGGQTNDGGTVTAFVGSALTRTVTDGREPRLLVAGVELTIQRGEMVLLAGPSGSGKTTLLHLVSGFDEPTAGQRSWGAAHRSASGGPLRQPPDWSEVAVVPQSLGLLPELSYAEHVQLAARPASASTSRSDVSHVLDIAHLAHRLPHETSLGQQQRLAVCRALVAEPDLVVADEPTSHQDGHHARAVVDALRNAGCACLIASHDPLFAAVADRVLTMIDGHVAESPNPT
jgi:ABC-type lipoprotein export system ATPase subunit